MVTPQTEPTGWIAAQVRVTVFAAGGGWNPRPEAWTELGLAEAPTSARVKGETTEQGPELDNWLIVQTTASRIDFVYVPNPEVDDAIFLDVGPADEAGRRFADFLSPWLSGHCPEISRMALGIVARIPVRDRNEGYRRLGQFVPVQLDPEGSSDFLYQINRPRPSKAVPGMTVNRLTQWSVATVAQMAAELPVGPAAQAADIRFGEARHWCQAALDINNVPGPQPLPRGQVTALLDEFLALATEITGKGDVK